MKRFNRWIFGLALLLVFVLSACKTSPNSPSEGGQSVTISVSETVEPSIPAVEGLNEGDPSREVGALLDSEGKQSEMVLNELMLAVYNQAQLDDFLARWNGTVLDVLAKDEFSDPEDPDDYLIQIDPNTADTSSLIENWLKTEPAQLGNFQVTNEDTLGLLAIMMYETSVVGNEVSINWLAQAQDISNAVSLEASNLNKNNAFEWDYVKSGRTQDVGLDVAWQLLEDKNKLDNKVKIMIVDGGFTVNPDFPNVKKIRQASWDQSNPMNCSGGNACPWHGTQVAVVAMGQMDNEYGAAGPAAPVAELIAVHAWPDFWKRMRRTKQMIKEERPDIVNMSFSWDVSNAQGAIKSAANRHLKAMKNMGALIFAASGNDGFNVDTINKEVIPCESKYVVCVGGLNTNSLQKHSGSNYGTKTGTETVEIYAPYCTYVLDEPNSFVDSKAKTGCGTSYSSPFVAGVAALVKAADPSLNPDEIWAIVKETAHIGVAGIETGNQRRINAFAAVNRALGFPYTEPALSIQSPSSNEAFASNDMVEFKGVATDFKDMALPILWTSSLDGVLNSLGEPSISSVAKFGSLSLGTHQITATVIDLRGNERTLERTITVSQTPTVTKILAPASSSEFYEGISLNLIGHSEDPDNFNQKLADSDVRWIIRRQDTNAKVFDKSGHSQVATLAAGTYLVSFDSDDSNTAPVSITVQEIPEGESPPTATILSPDDDAKFTLQGGVDSTATLNLKGLGTDPQNGTLSGTRYRWTAIDEKQNETILCQGSSFAPSGGIGVLNNCEERSVELTPLFYGDGFAKYVIRLEVKDFAGLVNSDEIGINIDVVVP